MIVWSTPAELMALISLDAAVFCKRCGWAGVRGEIVDDSGAERCSYDVDEPARHDCILCPECGSDEIAMEDLSDDDIEG